MAPALDNFVLPRRSLDHRHSHSQSHAIRSSSTATEPSGALLESELDELETREPYEQLSLLTGWLQKATRIRDGAENLLEATQTKGSQRGMIETELMAAHDRIRVLQEHIEMLRDQLDSAKNLRKKVSASHMIAQPAPRRRLFVGRARGDSTENKDDFRTAMSTTSTLIRTLQCLPPVLATSPLPVPSSPSSPPLNTEGELDRLRVGTMTKLISVLQRNMRVRYELDMDALTTGVLPALSDHAPSPTRILAYRLLKLLLPIPSAPSILLSPQNGIHFYLTRSLLSKQSSNPEREEAVMFIRAIVDLGAPVALDEGVVRILVSMAECEQDNLKGVVLETLTEIMLLDTPLASRTGIIQSLLSALVDGPPEFGQSLTQAFLVIMDMPRTRGYLRPGVDIEVIISGITDSYGKPYPAAPLYPSTAPPGLTQNHSTSTSSLSSHHPALSALRTSASLTTLLLRSWSGLLYLSMTNLAGVRALINTLKVPSLSSTAREAVLDAFFGLFGIRVPEWHVEFVSGRRLTMYRKPLSRSRSTDFSFSASTSGETDVNGVDEGTSTSNGAASTTPEQSRVNLLEQYLAMLLVILKTAGLFDALIFLLEEAPSGCSLARKATLLVGEILEVANRVIPLRCAAEIQSLPRLFELAASFAGSTNRTVGASTLALIDSFNRNRARLQGNSYGLPTTMGRERSNSSNTALSLVDEASTKRQPSLMSVSTSALDDRGFQLQLLEAGVMNTKDHKQWNLEVLMMLLEGPLTNVRRFEEALRVSKFIRRLMQFFHPFDHQYSDLKNLKSNQKWTKLGIALLQMLLSTPESRNYFINDDPFLKQLVECFVQLDPAKAEANPIFSAARIEGTLTCGYFEMIGVMCRIPEGMEVLTKFHFFTALYGVSELPGREDLLMSVLQNLDYSSDGHARIVLRKALTSPFKGFRIAATTHLGDLVRGAYTATTWTLKLLLTQLYDPTLEVCELAIHYLEEACKSHEVLQMVVEMQPTLDHLDEIAQPLLLKFMSTRVGFRYLQQSGYIESEINMWFNERNYHYVVQVEIALAKAFEAMGSEDSSRSMDTDGTVPPHFYGEVAKTESGCRILHEKRHVPEFATFLAHHGLECEDFDLIRKLKSVLWAVGHIGASDGGLPFLEEHGIVGTIVEIARQSLVLSVRGTCFFALALIASTSQGVDILEDYGWEAAIKPDGRTKGLCVPRDVREFVEIPTWHPYPPPEPQLLKESSSTMEAELETAIWNLANPVVQNSTSRGLQKLKQRHDTRFLFDSVPAYYRALHAISTGRYTLATRKFILDLFDFQLDTTLVKELNTIGQSLILDDSSSSGTSEEPEEIPEEEHMTPVPPIPPPPPAGRKRANTRARISMMTPRVNDDGSDVEVDVVGGILGNEESEDTQNAAS